MHYKFLPPYSPNYNPIKLLFSTMKYCLQQNGSYVCFTMNKLSTKEIHVTLTEVVCDITLQDTWRWYHHCGYVYIVLAWHQIVFSWIQLWTALTIGQMYIYKFRWCSPCIKKTQVPFIHTGGCPQIFLWHKTHYIMHMMCLIEVGGAIVA